jgi:hypothetical protein
LRHSRRTLIALATPVLTFEMQPINALRVLTQSIC